MPRTPLTAMGICGGRRELDRTASSFLPGATGTGTTSFPGMAGILALHHQPPQPSIQGCPGCEAEEQNAHPWFQEQGSETFSLEGTSRCFNPNSSLFRQ